MITAQSIKDHLRKLLNSSNEKTGLNDGNLTSAINSLVAGYKTKQCIGGIHITTTLNNVKINEASTKYTGKISINSPYSLDSVTLNGVSVAGNTVSTNDFSKDIAVGAIYWSLSNDGVLTIAGSGTMQDYSSFTGMPWSDSRDSVKKIATEDGITHIGARSFYRCINATKAYIPLSVKSIGDSAFYRCDALTEVYYEGTVAEWNMLMENAGTNNEKLTSATITCSDATFLQCDTLCAYPGVGLTTNSSGPADLFSSTTRVFLYSSDDSLGAKYSSSYYAIPIPEGFSYVKLSVDKPAESDIKVTSISVDLYNYDTSNKTWVREYDKNASSSGNETIDLSEVNANCMYFTLYFSGDVPSDYDVSQVHVTFWK